MLKILQARLQQYVNHELPDVQAGFRKGRGTRDQIAESEEELKSLLMKVKVESEKFGIKLSIQKTIMASGPITSWEIDEETVETVSDFILGAPKPLQMVIAAMKFQMFKLVLEKTEEPEIKLPTSAG